MRTTFAAAAIVLACSKPFISVAATASPGVTVPCDFLTDGIPLTRAEKRTELQTEAIISVQSDLAKDFAMIIVGRTGPPCTRVGFASSARLNYEL